MITISALTYILLGYCAGNLLGRCVAEHFSTNDFDWYNFINLLVALTAFCCLIYEIFV